MPPPVPTEPALHGKAAGVSDGRVAKKEGGIRHGAAEFGPGVEGDVATVEGKPSRGRVTRKEEIGVRGPVVARGAGVRDGGKRSVAEQRVAKHPSGSGKRRRRADAEKERHGEKQNTAGAHG